MDTEDRIIIVCQAEGVDSCLQPFSKFFTIILEFQLLICSIQLVLQTLSRFILLCLYLCHREFI